MPVIARDALLQRLRSSEMFTQLREDVAILTGARLELWAEEDFPVAQSRIRSALCVPVSAGTVTIGNFLVFGRMDSQRSRALTRWLEAAAYSLAERLTHQHPQSLSQADALPGAIAKAAKILRERFTEPLDLRSVAEEVGLSRERLSRLFHASLGVTFSDYLNLVRLKHCRERLALSDASIADIAFDCGFQSLSQFNRRFKAGEGISPREFRARPLV
jgi:transcriptional regulator GlxA family with amidase domain